jgi:hypothetical protein
MHPYAYGRGNPSDATDEDDHRTGILRSLDDSETPPGPARCRSYCGAGPPFGVSPEWVNCCTLARIWIDTSGKVA